MRRRLQQSGIQIHHRTPARHDHSWVWLNLRLSLFRPVNCCRAYPETNKNVEFKWRSEKQASFKLKELITSRVALAHFNVNSKTRIVADASPVGLRVVLIQLQGIEWRVMLQEV